MAPHYSRYFFGQSSLHMNMVISGV